LGAKLAVADLNLRSYEEFEAEAKGAVPATAPASSGPRQLRRLLNNLDADDVVMVTGSTA
jgi:hypothetical protein